MGVTVTFDISDIDATGSIPITNMGQGIVYWNETDESAGWRDVTRGNFYIISNTNGIVSVYLKLSGNPQRPVSAIVALYVAV